MFFKPLVHRPSIPISESVYYNPRSKNQQLYADAEERKINKQLENIKEHLEENKVQVKGVKPTILSLIEKFSNVNEFSKRFDTAELERRVQ